MYYLARWSWMIQLQCYIFCLQRVVSFSGESCFHLMMLWSELSRAYLPMGLVTYLHEERIQICLYLWNHWAWKGTVSLVRWKLTSYRKITGGCWKLCRHCSALSICGKIKWQHFDLTVMDVTGWVFSCDDLGSLWNISLFLYQNSITFRRIYCISASLRHRRGSFCVACSFCPSYSHSQLTSTFLGDVQSTVLHFRPYVDISQQ